MKIFLTNFTQNDTPMVFVRKSLNAGETIMAKVGADVPQTDAKAPFPYRTVISIILLAGNFVVAAIYFHILNP